MFELKIGWRKRCRPVKRWIGVVEEDMRKRGVVQQDAGDREGEGESGERTGQPPLVGKICQDNKLMMMHEIIVFVARI